MKNISAMPTSSSSTSKSSPLQPDSSIPNVSLSFQACRCPHLDAILPQTIDIRVLLNVHNDTPGKEEYESEKSKNDYNRNIKNKQKNRINGAEAIQLLHLTPFLDSSPFFTSNHELSNDVKSTIPIGSCHNLESSTKSNKDDDNENSTNRKYEENDLYISNHKNETKKNKSSKNSNSSSNNKDNKNLFDDNSNTNKIENEDNTEPLYLALESFDHKYSHLTLKANTQDHWKRTLKNEKNLNDRTERTKKQKTNNSTPHSEGTEKDGNAKNRRRNKPRFIDSDDEIEDQILQNQPIMSDSIKNEKEDRQVTPPAPKSLDIDITNHRLYHGVLKKKENKVDKCSNTTNESSEYYLPLERYEQLRQAEHEQNDTLFFESLADEEQTPEPENPKTESLAKTKRTKLKKTSSIFSSSSSSSSSINTLVNSSPKKILSNDVVIECTVTSQDLESQYAENSFKKGTNEKKETEIHSKIESTNVTSIDLTNVSKQSSSKLKNELSYQHNEISHRRSKKRRNFTFNNEVAQNDLLLDTSQVSALVNQWIHVFRKSRDLYWKQKLKALPSLSTCTYIPNNSLNSNHRAKEPLSSFLMTDGLMKCLECSVLGYGPSFSSDSYTFQTKENLMSHFITSGHSFGVTCGHRSELFCMRCGDFVYHPILDREKLRIDLSHHLPFFSWKEDIIKRSADVFPMRSLVGVSHDWPKLEATYPCAVSPIFIDIAKQNLKRYQILHGNLEDSLTWGRKATTLALSQYKYRESGNFQINAPIGIYNLGNTCYVNCVLQCLLHCVPLQHFFLNNVGHNYATCKSMRKKCLIASSTKDALQEGSKSTNPYKEKVDCLACALDRIFLETLSSTIGTNIIDALEEPSSIPDINTHQYKEKNLSNESKAAIEINGNGKSATKVRNANGNIEYSSGSKSNHSYGLPLVPVSFLTTSWKSRGMSHLAGYEQRDAHEFLHAFLDTIGKDNKTYYDLAQKMGGGTFKIQKQCIGMQRKHDSDIVKKIFEGTLRSVLVCECCGCKRTQPEPFVIISLPISKAKGKGGSVPQSNKSNEKGTNPTSSRRGSSNLSKITIEKCLTQFTEPELLTDPVYCTSCDRNTPTKKQHTFARLPMVLCLHLKRFDAQTNKKIEHTVSYPVKGLNMGMTLPHWCEISQAKTSQMEDTSSFLSTPDVLYDLFGTVNHVGNLHQGHYTANVKVKNGWYGCNDAFISEFSMEEKEASGIDNAYILFYMRREKKNQA